MCRAAGTQRQNLKQSALHQQLVRTMSFAGRTRPVNHRHRASKAADFETLNKRSHNRLHRRN
jgi:hypothetical protein